MTDEYWYRMEQSLGRNSVVGTTIKSPELLPDNVAADEKHSRLKGEKVYVPTTVGDQCILGACVSENAGERGLKKGYGKFKEEALNLNPEYALKIREHRRVESHYENLDFPVSDDMRYLLFSARFHKDSRSVQ